MNDTVAAVVVTYNRRQLLMECLDALLSQTKPVDKIIIIDNASTDGTPGVLQKRGYLENPLIKYVRFPENTGGAGGFHEGIKCGYEAGYDWLWLMDDDAEPYVDSLEKLRLEDKASDVLAVANVPVDKKGFPQKNHRGWGRFCCMYGGLMREVDDSDLRNYSVDIELCSFVGLVVRRDAVDNVGYPIMEFFIHNDDLEYCYRISRRGRIVMVNDSFISHKEVRKSNYFEARLLGVRFSRVSMQDLWIKYYGVRNLFWIRKKYCSMYIWVFYVFLWCLFKFSTIAIFDDHKYLRVRFYLNAVWDGLTGCFDNEKPKKLLD